MTPRIAGAGGSAGAAFGVEPSEVVATANALQAQSDVVSEISLNEMSAVSGSMSMVMDVLRSMPGNVNPVFTSISSQLDEFGTRLHRFTATAEANDESIAQGFRDMSAR